MITENCSFNIHIKMHLKQFRGNLMVSRPNLIFPIHSFQGHHDDPTLSSWCIPSIWCKTVKYWGVRTLIGTPEVPDVLLPTFLPLWAPLTSPNVEQFQASWSLLLAIALNKAPIILFLRFIDIHFSLTLRNFAFDNSCDWMLFKVS